MMKNNAKAVKADENGLTGSHKWTESNLLVGTGLAGFQHPARLDFPIPAATDALSSDSVSSDAPLFLQVLRCLTAIEKRSWWIMKYLLPEQRIIWLFILQLLFCGQR